jgi:hypothetical protein
MAPRSRPRPPPHPGSPASRQGRPPGHHPGKQHSGRIRRTGPYRFFPPPCNTRIALSRNGLGPLRITKQPSNSGPRVCEPLLQGRSCIRPAGQVRPSISPGGRLRALTQPSTAPSVHPAEAQHARRKAASRHQTLPCLPAAPHSMPPSAPAREAAARLPAHLRAPKPPVPRGPKPSRPARISLTSGLPAAESVHKNLKSAGNERQSPRPPAPTLFPTAVAQAPLVHLSPRQTRGSPLTRRHRPRRAATDHSHQHSIYQNPAGRVNYTPTSRHGRCGDLNPAPGTWPQLYPTGTSPHPRFRPRPSTGVPTPPRDSRCCTPARPFCFCPEYLAQI